MGNLVGNVFQTMLTASRHGRGQVARHGRTGRSRPAKRTRSLSGSGNLAGPEGLMRRLMWGEGTGAVGDTPATAATAADMDIGDGTSVDRDSKCMDVVDKCNINFPCLSPSFLAGFEQSLANDCHHNFNNLLSFQV